MSNASRKRPLERRADVPARRVISLLSQAPLVLSNCDSSFYRNICADRPANPFLRYGTSIPPTASRGCRS